MPQKFLAIIALFSPAVFAVTALISWFHPGLRPSIVKRMATASTCISIVVAVICGILVFRYDILQTDMIGFREIGLSLRLDTISVVMLVMIALIGFIVVRFSLNYLDGDKRQGIFIGRLAATICSVQLLVLTGNLGLLWVSWILTSISLHRLLVFYPDRPGAQVAAKKKFILARLADACLLIACILLYKQFNTGNLELIFMTLKHMSSSGVHVAGLEVTATFLVLAALLKSAQFPTHGWLIEVMETPTPVSALLHAGLLNAGPFLVIRMAHVIQASTIAPIMLISIGGFTALFASTAYLTQTSVKTALSYSSVAHMGFSLLLCGLGLYPAAMLHLVAHSFYKAHAFLSSGSVIEVARGSKVAESGRLGSPLRILLGIAMALALYSLFALVWGINPAKELPLLAIGAILIMGLSRLFSSATDSKESITMLVPAVLLALLVTAAFFSLEAGAHHMLASQLPLPSALGIAEIVLTGILLIAFGLIVFIQMLPPVWSQTRFRFAMAIHIRNGFYANALFDKLIGAIQIHAPQRKPLTIDERENFNILKTLEIGNIEEQPA